MIDLIEGCFDVKLNHPVVFPAPLSGDSNRLFRRSPRPISIGIWVEYRVEYRFNDELGNRLANPIRHSGNTELAKATLSLRNFYLHNRWRDVRPRRHLGMTRFGGRLRS